MSELLQNTTPMLEVEKAAYLTSIRNLVKELEIRFDNDPKQYTKKDYWNLILLLKSFLTYEEEKEDPIINTVLSVDVLPKYGEYITVDGKTYLSSNHIIKCHNEYYQANENCAGLDLKLDGISGSLHDHLHNIEPYFCFNDENEQCLNIDGTVLLDSGVQIFGKVAINPKNLQNEDRKFYWNGVSITFSPIKLNSSFVITVATKDFKEEETNTIPENLQAHIKKYECYYTFSEENCELQLSIFLNGVLLNTCMSKHIDELYIPLDKAEYMSIESIDGIMINNIVFNDLYYFTDTYIDGTIREYQVRKRPDWSPLHANINDYDIEQAFCLPILEESILSLFEIPECTPNYHGTNQFIKSIPKNEIKTLF